MAGKIARPATRSPGRAGRSMAPTAGERTIPSGARGEPVRFSGAGPARADEDLPCQRAAGSQDNEAGGVNQCDSYHESSAALLTRYSRFQCSWDPVAIRDYGFRARSTMLCAPNEPATRRVSALELPAK